MQIIFNGLIQGLLTALIALGFSLVYNTTGIFHIAQGAVYAIAPFILLSFIQAGMGWPLALITSLVAAIIISIVIELINHSPLDKKGASKEIHLISSLGAYIILTQIIAIIWGNETKVLREGIDITYTFGDVILVQSQVIGGTLSIFLLFGFFYWLKRTNLGLQFQAMSDNPIQLALLGYDTGRLRLLVFALSGLFTASAAMLTALDVGFDPHGGLTAVLIGMVATIIGGRGSFVGPVIGGVILGIIRAQITWHTSARWEEAATFLLLALFLFFRPQGILGKRGRIEAQ